MDAAWQPYELDAERTAQVLYYAAGISPLQMVNGTAGAGSPNVFDLSPYVSQLRQSASEASITLSWHTQLEGNAQPEPGEMVEIKLDGQSLWWGIIDAVNDYRLQSGQRSLTLVARSRDASPLWREVRRVTDIYPTATPLAYIAREVAYSLGLTDAELLLPVSSGYTVHSNVQLADLSGWQMLEQIYQAGGYMPFVDGKGRLKTISRDVSRPADVELEDDRIVSINGSRNRSAVTLVRVKWLDPNLTKVSQQDQVLANATITSGFFQLEQEQVLTFSDDGSQRAESTYMVVKQSANSGLIDFCDEEYEQLTLTEGQITVTTSVFAPLLATASLAAIIFASKIPDAVVGTVTVPTGRIVHGVAETTLLLVMMSLGTGMYEIRGHPYDYVHARNITEAYDCDAPDWQQREVDIENDFITSEEAAQALAVRELIYQNKNASTWSISIVDDPRIEPGDIVELHDGTRIYVTGYTRNLTHGAPAVLELEGFRVP